MTTSEKLLALCDFLEDYPADELLVFFRFLNRYSLCPSTILSLCQHEIEASPEDWPCSSAAEHLQSTRGAFQNVTGMMDLAKLGSTRELSDEVVDRLTTLVGDETLDAYFARKELGMVPGIVTRWKDLKTFHVVGLPEERVTEYLRQAITCYLHGLPSAVVILCRAVLEFALTEAIVSLEGPPLEPNLKPTLDKLIARANESGLLTPEMAAVATRIRRDGNSAIHSRAFNDAAALTALRQVRDILRHLYKVPSDG